MKRALYFSVLLWLIAASPADAHLMTTGLGPFYDGMAHLFVSPDDLIAVIALSLLGGLRGPRNGRTVLWFLPLTWMIANFAGRELLSPLANEAAWAAVSAVVTVAVGALVASDIGLPHWLISGAAVVLGAIHGALNGAEAVTPGSYALIPIGNAISLFVVVALVAGQAVVTHGGTPRIIARVAGSWIAAIGLLLFGWSMKA